jgi:hypothetical protein
VSTCRHHDSLPRRFTAHCLTSPSAARSATHAGDGACETRPMPHLQAVPHACMTMTCVDATTSLHTASIPPRLRPLADPASPVAPNGRAQREKSCVVRLCRVATTKGKRSGGPIARGLQAPASFTRPCMKRHVQIPDRPLRLRTWMALDCRPAESATRPMARAISRFGECAPAPPFLACSCASVAVKSSKSTIDLRPLGGHGRGGKLDRRWSTVAAKLHKSDFERRGGGIAQVDRFVT